MPTIQDTIYPRFKASISDADLDRVYTPTPQECALAAQTTKGEAAYLGFLILLKTFQRLGYFVFLADIPDPIITHIAQAVDHRSFIDQLATYDRSGSRKRHQTTIRAYQCVKPFRDGGAAVIQQAVAVAAIHTEQLDDLINRAIEELIHQSYELPGFTTLIKEAQKQRTKTYTLLYQQVVAVLTPELQAGLDNLFTVDPLTQRSLWDTLKDTPGKPTLTNLKAIADRLTWFETYQAAIAAVIDFPEAKRSHFATEALAYDTTAMHDTKAPRRYTLACVLLATQYAQTLDDLTETFIKRIRSIQHDAKEALQAYQEQHQARTDKLITALRDLVVGYQQEGTAEHRFAAMEGVLQGRSTDLLQDCDAHLTYAGSNFAPFVWNAYKSHRATVFRLLKLLPFRPGGSDPKIGQAIAFLLRHERTKSPWISLKVPTPGPDPLTTDMPTLDLSWIPVGWWRLVTGVATRDVVPHEINRRQFEACVVSRMLSALNVGDLSIVGADRFGDPFPRLLSWDTYHAQIDMYGEHLGLPIDADAFIADQQQWLTNLADTTNTTFPANTQVTLEKGRPVIRRRRKKPDPPGLAALKRKLDEYRRPRSIIDALGDTIHWLKWTDHFGPLSGFEAKIDDPLERYLATVFCYGCQLGPTETVRSLGILERWHLTWADQHHISEANLDAVIQCFITAYQRCSLPRLWGSLSHASIDGTKWEMYEQNLLSEQHIRYGGYGGIALYLLSSTYIALMSNFIACSAWEGHYLLDVLEQNRSVVQPTMIHSDTQGQNEAIFGLAFLRGIDLLPRIRNWQDLILYRPTAESTYTHIDSIFSAKAIDWELIRMYLPDLLRMALSIKEGRIAPSTILRTISAGHSKLAQACRELGRVRRTGFLLKFIADSDLRTLIHRETNKSEQFNGFTKWLGFGSAGVIRENDRPAQRKAIKYNVVVANAMLFYNTVKLTHDLRALIHAGYYVDAACVAALNPYGTKDFERFGKYTLSLAVVPDPVDYAATIVSDVPNVTTASTA